jgi:hypothetical protein
MTGHAHEPAQLRSRHCTPHGQRGGPACTCSHLSSPAGAAAPAGVTPDMRCASSCDSSSLSWIHCPQPSGHRQALRSASSTRCRCRRELSGCSDTSMGAVTGLPGPLGASWLRSCASSSSKPTLKPQTPQRAEGALGAAGGGGSKCAFTWASSSAGGRRTTPHTGQSSVMSAACCGTRCPTRAVTPSVSDGRRDCSASGVPPGLLDCVLRLPVCERSCAGSGELVGCPALPVAGPCDRPEIRSCAPQAAELLVVKDGVTPTTCLAPPQWLRSRPSQRSQGPGSVLAVLRS